MADSLQTRLASLQDERKRLDALLDDAVAQYALVEEDLNARMKTASPAQVQALMAERARIEDALGIAALVDRIDAVREEMARLQAGTAV